MMIWKETLVLLFAVVSSVQLQIRTSLNGEPKAIEIDYKHKWLNLCTTHFLDVVNEHWTKHMTDVCQQVQPTCQLFFQTTCTYNGGIKLIVSRLDSPNIEEVFRIINGSTIANIDNFDIMSLKLSTITEIIKQGWIFAIEIEYRTTQTAFCTTALNAVNEHWRCSLTEKCHASKCHVFFQSACTSNDSIITGIRNLAQPCLKQNVACHDDSVLNTIIRAPDTALIDGLQLDSLTTVLQANCPPFCESTNGEETGIFISVHLNLNLPLSCTSHVQDRVSRDIEKDCKDFAFTCRLGSPPECLGLKRVKVEILLSFRNRSSNEVFDMLAQSSVLKIPNVVFGSIIAGDEAKCSSYYLSQTTEQANSIIEIRYRIVLPLTCTSQLKQHVDSSIQEYLSRMFLFRNLNPTPHCLDLHTITVFVRHIPDQNIQDVFNTINNTRLFLYIEDLEVINITLGSKRPCPPFCLFLQSLVLSHYDHPSWWETAFVYSNVSKLVWFGHVAGYNILLKTVLGVPWREADMTVDMGGPACT